MMTVSDGKNGMLTQEPSWLVSDDNYNVDDACGDCFEKFICIVALLRPYERHADMWCWVFGGFVF